MAYQPIENYGIIGNMRTVALVGMNGSIDWYCYPHFDSPSVFGAILDDKKGGHFQISADSDGVRHKQFYWPSTNVLVTRFLMADGIAELEDFMPVGLPSGSPAYRHVYRRIRCVRGTVRISLTTLWSSEVCPDGFDLAIHSGDLPDSPLVARRFAQTMTILVATPQYLARFGAPKSPEELKHFRSVVFVERGSVQPWSFASGQNATRVIPTGVFRTSDIEQMRMGVLEHLGIAQAPAWLFAAELREGTVIRLLTAFERTVPILAVRPASRRLSTRVRIFIEHLEKTFALCSQFNPRPS
jgi:hypothetical protein